MKIPELTKNLKELGCSKEFISEVVHELKEKPKNSHACISITTTIDIGTSSNSELEVHKNSECKAEYRW